MEDTSHFRCNRLEALNPFPRQQHIVRFFILLDSPRLLFNFLILLSKTQSSVSFFAPKRKKMSIIGEAILTASVDLLVYKLASVGIRLFPRQDQIRADLMKWKTMLLKIKAVLADAEEKKRTDEIVKLWLGELQNLALMLKTCWMSFKLRLSGGCCCLEMEIQLRLMINPVAVVQEQVSFGSW